MKPSLRAAKGWLWMGGPWIEPPRLVGVPTECGIAALGVDITPVAVDLTVRRSGFVLRCSVFDCMQEEGC